MATQRQIEANRRNARSSTGPRTEAGKAASSANALSHGLTAAGAVVLPEEDPDAFERLRAGVIADLAPAGALQRALAQRVAVLLWRLDRVARLEAELFVHGRLSVLRGRMGEAAAAAATASAVLGGLLDQPEEARQLQQDRASIRREIDEDIDALVPSAHVLVERRQSARAFDRIARHEAMLQRALNRTLDEFRRLRDAPGVTAGRQAPVHAAPPADPDPAPAGEAPAGAAQGGEEAFLQNEANSAQAPELAADSGARAASPQAGAGTPRGPEGPEGAFRTG